MAFPKAFQDTVLDRFLQLVRHDRRRVEIITRNGYHMYGYITDADERAILVEVDGVNRLVMMATVSTIIPRYPKAVTTDVE